jgi:Tetratricopeptide repeat
MLRMHFVLPIAPNYNQGKFEQAEPMFKHALTLREQLFGREHPRTLVILHNLTRCQNTIKQ